MRYMCVLVTLSNNERIHKLLLLLVVVVLSVTGIQHDVERCRVSADAVANGAKKLLYGSWNMIRSRSARCMH